MNELFLKVINISISASWLILAVLALRLVLKKAPKWIHVLLWGIAAVRLLLPFSVESALSLIPNAETIPMDIEMDAAPAIDSGIYSINSMVNPVIRQFGTPDVGASVNPMQILVSILSYGWVFGIVALFVYAIVSYWRLCRKVDTAVLYCDNIFQSENVSSPFVLGIVRPRIYLPFKMDGRALECVVAHERAHICRKDHWWKPFGFLLLTFHWFNPLVWLAYVLLCRDIELACDEKVIRKLGNEQRANYTQALLDCSINRHMIAACPLAFGEVGVKERVKSVMNYKRPAFWIIIVSLIICIIVAVCFLTNPKQSVYDIKIVVPAGSHESMVYSDEEISPTKRQIIITSGDNLGDTEVTLKPIEAKQENAYDTYGPMYLTPGMPVKMDVEQGAWFQVGINMQNPTEEDMVVYVSIKNIEVRIEDKALEDSDNSELSPTQSSDSETNFPVGTRKEEEVSSAISGTDGMAGMEASSLEDAISQAILGNAAIGKPSALRYADWMPESLIHAESHYIAYTEEKDDSITVYLQAYESSYRVYKGSLYQESGSDIPTAITFSVDEGGQYALKEYWIPREGSYYMPDIQNKFPKEALDALDAAKEEIQKMAQECKDKAMAQLENAVGLEVRIAELLDVISSSPATFSANPRDYIEAHDAEYQELLGYGEYTLQYCIAEFLEGGQTGLKGHFMRIVLDELAPDLILNLQAATGQEYFDEWKVSAIQAAEQHDADWVEKYQPAIRILLQMMEE